MKRYICYWCERVVNPFSQIVLKEVNFENGTFTLCGGCYQDIKKNYPHKSIHLSYCDKQKIRAERDAHIDYKEAVEMNGNEVVEK